MKLPPRNPIHQEFPKIPRAQCPNFAKIFNFDFVKISLAQNCSIFNNSCIISLNTTKPPKCNPSSSRAFQ
jgi:hypothetical protein